MNNITFIELAYQEAKKAIARHDEPYGAIIVSAQGEIIASCGNEENTTMDPTSHAEMNAIRMACHNLNSKSLNGCSIYANYKPCPMCAAAILMTGIKRIYVGSSFPGLTTLYTKVIESIENSDVVLKDSLMAEKCQKQVDDARIQMLLENPNYVSGHKNGIL